VSGIGPPGSHPSGHWVGRHRAPISTRRKVLVRLVAPLVAVVAVAAVVLVLIGFFGHSSGNAPGPGVVTAASSPTVAPSTTPTLSPTPTPKPTPTTTPTHTPKPPPPKPTHHPAALTAMAPVRVYNSTTIQGLAHEVASEIEERGWTVTDIGNVSGASSLTTLYYGPGAKAAAQHLAREFSGIRQIEPDGSAGISGSGLTLILTADWHN
jgi:hypothetical protein